MSLLAIETSSSACSVALRHRDQIFISHKIAPMQHAKILLPMIYSLLAEHSLQITDIQGICFGAGPGSFTGIRIASSVTQGLAYGLDCPIIKISSLAVLAQQAYREKNWKNLLVAVDARMGDIYWATYCVNKHGLVELKGKEAVIKPQEADERFAHSPFYGVGDGWLQYADTLKSRFGLKSSQIDTSLFPHATALLSLALPHFKQNEQTPLNQAIPTYLR